MKRFDEGFTLIELLIVIAIIGILAGVVIAVINPSKQRTRAQEGVLRGNVSKICMAWAACKASAPGDNSTYCDSVDELGITSPTAPSGALYSYTSSRWQGALGTCTIYCDPTTNSPTLSGTCAIK